MSILRADSIRDRAGTGAPDFPNGATVTGVVTATSFSGNVTGNVTGNADTATSATSATTATNAQGLTGTPNITVGTVTGTDATFSGNLTVQGTTTTIDTAVTAVDSLAVDGNVGIGTTNALAKLHVNLATDRNIAFNVDGGGQSRISSFNDTSSVSQVLGLNGSQLSFQTSNTERVRITSDGTAIFKAGLAEKYNNTGTTLDADPTHDITAGNVILCTGNEPNSARSLHLTGIHSILAIGESVSFTVIISPNGTGTITGLTVDGAGQTIKWSGGSAPSAGASGRDVYTFTLLKTGSANTNYEVFGAATNYA